jgi:hypothetical protein
LTKTQRRRIFDSRNTASQRKRNIHFFKLVAVVFVCLGALFRASGNPPIAAKSLNKVVLYCAEFRGVKATAAFGFI